MSQKASQSPRRMPRMLDARSMLIENTPQLPVYADKPEPPRPDVRWLKKRDVLRRFGWTEEDFEYELTLDFPVASRRTKAGFWAVTLIWREDGLDAWRQMKREKAEKDLRLVGADRK